MLVRHRVVWTQECLQGFCFCLWSQAFGFFFMSSRSKSTISFTSSCKRQEVKGQRWWVGNRFVNMTIYIYFFLSCINTFYISNIQSLNQCSWKMNVWQVKIYKNGNCTMAGDGCFLVHLFVSWGLKIKLFKCFPKKQFKVYEANLSSERRK